MPASNIAAPPGFQLTRPARGEPNLVVIAAIMLLISTHSPRAGRTLFLVNYSIGKDISTHSPHARRTGGSFTAVPTMHHFNSLAPREANPNQGDFARAEAQFQLTRPTRGEPVEVSCICGFATISTHSPHARRTDKAAERLEKFENFNSLAPREANRSNRTSL